MLGLRSGRLALRPRVRAEWQGLASLAAGHAQLRTPQPRLHVGFAPGCGILEKKGVATEACVPYRSFDPRKEKCDKMCPGESGGSMKNVTKATNVTHLTTEADMMGAIAEGPIGMLWCLLCCVHCWQRQC